uniref:CSON007094 protein n=1 Tax=Culicoides sonorensis TaxID=179676 RepID=A0A336LD68_CULSO
MSEIEQENQSPRKLRKISSNHEPSVEENLKAQLEKNKAGFDAENFHSTISCILNLDYLQNAKFSRYLFATAPKDFINRNTLHLIFGKILSWMSKESDHHSNAKSCLQYLIALIKYKIIDLRDIRGFYPFYFNLLSFPSVEVQAAELIYLTTTYNNLKIWFVQKIERIFQESAKNKKRLHLIALLQLFKRLKLGIVSIMDLEEVDEAISFTNINPILKKTVTKVCIRNKIKINEKEIRYENANLDLIALRSKAFKLNVHHFKQFCGLKDFLESYIKSSYDMYETCYDSMLDNKYSFVFLGILKHEEKEQANLYVQQVWSRIEENELDKAEIKNFFKNLHRINSIFGHDVFDVRENFATFLKSHEFFEYKDELLLLVKYLQYPNYELLFDELLSYLYKHFILAAQYNDLKCMCDIVTALSDFLYHNYKIKSNSFELFTTFSDSDLREEISEIDLGVAITAIQHFCKILMNVGHGNFRAMLTVMQFYEKLNKAEELFQLNTINMIPTEMSHSFFVNPNIILLDKFATLIHKMSMLAENNEMDRDHTGLVLVAKQARELYIFFFRNPQDTSLFQKENLIVRHSILYRKIIYLNTRRIYVLKHNPAFLHLTRLDVDGKLIDEENVKLDVKQFYKECRVLMELLTTIKSSWADDDKASDKII